jgi:predicted enzyme related to lactoylglutathione lyase
MVKGKVTHFEIPVEKMERARKFYADTFGWNVMDMPGQAPGMPYVMAIGAETDERGMVTEKGAINGGIIKRAAPLQHPIITVDVDDMDGALDKVKKNGGKVLVKKTAMAQMGFFAYFQDTEGNVMGLWQSTSGM